MENYKVLFKIKTLEKMLARKFFSEKSINFENEKNMPTPTQMHIIEYMLTHENEKIYQKDLEKVLNLRRATVSGVLQTMEKNNLIIRITNCEDSRSKEIMIKDNAKEMFLKGHKKIDELEQIVISGISEEELKVFSNVIEKMKQNISII